jgi:hypothetical protein
MANNWGFSVHSTQSGYRMWQWSRDARTVNLYEHVMVWESYFGPVPNGYQVHHEDENRTNNAIDNLRCLLRLDHKVLHSWKQPCVACGESIKGDSRLKMCGKCYMRSYRQARR